MKFSICNEVFEGWKFNDICAAVRDAGYTGIEIAPFTTGKLAGEITREERCAMHSAAAQYGLEIVGLHWVLAQTQGFHINSPDRTVRERTKTYLIDLINLCSDLGGRVIIFGSPKQRCIAPELTRQQAWNYALETFCGIVPTLEDRGITFCLEPLAPEETNFINTADDAAEIISAIDSPSFQLLLDVKAMSSEQTPIPQIIQKHKSIVKHFHANDANKRGPGFGNTDFTPIAAALKEINYTGWVSVEVFDFKPDPVTITTESINYLRNVFTDEGARE